MRSKRSLCAGVSLSLASLLTLPLLPGCSKLEELTGSKEEEAKPEEGEAKTKDGEDAKDDGSEAAADDGKEVVAEVEAAPVEAIPVEPMHTGLDLMLTLVPEGAEFMIARDATVVADYVDEATRFLDGPMATLKTGPFASEPDLAEAERNFDEVKAYTDKVKGALEGSGIDLAAGAAIIKAAGGASYVIYHAADAQALPNLGKATGESDLADLKCKAIDGMEGINVCADTQAMVDGYAPSSDPAPLRAQLTESLPGVLLDDVNLVGHFDEGKSDETWLAVSTIPGQVHIAVTQPNDTEIFETMKDMEPGPAKTLAQVQPGAGFVWAHLSKDLMAKATAEAKGSPAEAAAGALTGEFVIAGSVDPGGLIFQGGTTDTAGMEALLAQGFEMGKGQVPPSIPDMPAAKLSFAQVDLTGGGGTTAKALHLGVTGISEADVLKSYTGLHADAWAFAANDVFTLAIGPDAENVGKLLDATAGGPSQATLDTLPKALADGLSRDEVGMIVHMPMDFLHGAQMHSLARAALKDVPDMPVEQLLALASLAAPLSSATMWVSKPGGGHPVVHVAVQAIGNRATDEGRAALDAAHTVADGGDPAMAFSSLATAYAGSPMAWAYKTRAGTDGPGYMVGSGLGAVLAAAAVAVPVVMGVSSETLADDLGVKPEDPEPELKPTTTPKRPVTEPKKPEPTKDEPKKPEPTKDEPKKPEPVKPEPVKPEPTKDEPKGPIVEPTKPLPPKPTKDPVKKPGRRIGRKNNG